MQKLPIGIQTFKTIIEEDYIYIDKTPMAFDVINNYKYVFLSRPRRFGKSLFLDTLKNIFEGNKELFKGLYIYDKYDFDKYPVIKIDWSGDFKTLENTKNTAMEILKENQKRLGMFCEENLSADNCFRRLIRETYEKYKKPVVILIDEYDKPILDNLENPKIALQNRDFLRGFYGIMKANDEYIKFAFLTGISKFSKANIFSGLNMITDISLMSKYGDICGYTQEDIETRFKEYLKDVDLQKVKEWYNGYNFLGSNVYNPFDILRFIDNDFQFLNYWWESGNPYMLIALLKKNNYNIAKLENITVGNEILNSFEIEKLKLEVLLFQAGYLTIDKYIHDPDFGINEYKLKVPNKEIQISLNRLFLDYLTDGLSIDKNIIKALLNADLEKFEKVMKSFFASIPYNNYVKNNIGEYEGYYASVFYAYLTGAGLKVIPEDVTNNGRVDLTILLNDKVYVIEFKVAEEEMENVELRIENECNALKQIKEKKYYEKYLNSSTSQPLSTYLIGIEFDKQKRNIVNFEWELIKNY